MKQFNLNQYVLVQPTEYGIQEVIDKHGSEYWNVCMESETYYRMQAHQIITIWGRSIWAARPCPINVNILIPD